MRIAMVHSFYSSDQPSGENSSTVAEIAALEKAGHDVELFGTSTDDEQDGFLYRVRSGLRVATHHGRNPLDTVRNFEPDVVHIQNLFPNFGRRWVKDLEVPVVHTLRNFRPLCANGLLFREGNSCTLCIDGSSLNGLRYGCYRNSRVATAPITVAGLRGAQNDPLIRAADKLIVLSEFQRGVYINAGIPPEHLTVSPNFFPDALDPGPQLSPGDSFVTVGRLSPEKGFAALAEVWPRDQTLLIVGDGPDRQFIEDLRHPAIRMLGLLEPKRVIELLRTARALVFPSRCFETFGRTAMESLACGTPVLATEGNTVATMLKTFGGGSVTSWTDLHQGLRSIPYNKEARTEARGVYEANFTEAAFIQRIERIYRELVASDAKASKRS
jgi:glycosyltransferase involved in cell wall biosynthesis